MKCIVCGDGERDLPNRMCKLCHELYINQGWKINE